MLRLLSDKTQSLKEFTENNYAQGAFFWNVLLKNKDIKVNGTRVNKDVILKNGDEVLYYLTKKQEEKTAFFIVYEDENVLIADKTDGVNSEAVFAALSRRAEEKGERCFFIHRLDRNTKGLLAFAKTKAAEEELLSAFREKRAEKIYHALCFGVFKSSKDTLVGYLKKDAQRALAYVYDTPVNGAEKIITKYSVLDTQDDITKVEIVLHTGKTHQIRAHMAHIGCPVVGDMKYGDSERNKEKKHARQCLVAKRLRFTFLGELAYLNGKEWRSCFHAELQEKE